MQGKKAHRKQPTKRLLTSKAMLNKTQNMMQERSLPIDISTLPQSEPKYLQAQMVTAVILALGSNHCATKYLPLVREKLATLGTLECTAPFQNPDFTATKEQPKPDYINQCVYLELSSAMSLPQLQQLFKSFEGECHRIRESVSILPELSKVDCSQAKSAQTQYPSTKWRQVTMDIDILLVKLEFNQVSNNSQQDNHGWVIMADRYPFKAHEYAGITELTITNRLF